MIDFSYQNDFSLEDDHKISLWLSSIINAENKVVGDLGYVFCNDDFLHSINVEFLNHDTLTDVISFDYTEGTIINGEIYISTERVLENAQTLNVSFYDELDRVMAHGILHFCGHGDKSDDDKTRMRVLENHYLALRQ